MSVAPPPRPTPSPSPSPSPTPPTIHRDLDIWNPGGHPEMLRQAAQAWRDLARDLRAMEHDLGPQLSTLRGHWTGTTSDRAQEWGGRLGHSLTDSAAQCDRVAGQLDELAAKIQTTNDQVHELYVAMGVTLAVGIGLTVLTFGFSDAAAAGTAAAEAAEAASLVEILAGILESYLGRWVVAFVVNVGVTGIEKAIFNPSHNPLEGWTPADWAQALLFADALGVATPVAESFRGYAAFKSAHPFLAAATVSGSAAGTAAFANDLSALAFEGKPLGLNTLVDIGVTAGLSGTVSGLAELGALRFGARPATVLRGPRIVGTEPGIGLGEPGIEVPLRPAPPAGWAYSEGGLLRPVTGDLKIGGRSFPAGEPGPNGLVEARPPRLVEVRTPEPPQVGGIAPDQLRPGPGGLLVPKENAVRSSLGVTVEQPRVNLWQASKQLRKNTFKLDLKALTNAVVHPPSQAPASPGPMPAPPVVTSPGPAPTPPPPPPPPPPPHVVGGGTYTVRPGDSLWEIAHRTYGDGQMWQVLYRANAGIGANPNVIQPGQVLTLPAIAQPAA
jgi:uncharacterized protein YukE